MVLRVARLAFPPLLLTLALAAPLDADIFVGAGGQILSFYNFDSGNQEPRDAIGGAQTELSGIAALALDRANREIWVTDFNTDDVLVFDMDASGDVPPLRRISAAALITPRGLMIDLSHDEVHVVDFQADAVFVFPRTQNGDAAPIRTLTGALTGLAGPVMGFLDLVHDELYVGNYGGENARIAVFDRATADGDVAPLRTLEGAGSGINNPRGILVDLDSDLLVVAEYDLDAIRVYPRTASGPTPFLGEISGGLTGLEAPFQLAFTVHDELVTGTDTSTPARVLVHEIAGGGGNQPPDRVLAGAATELDNPTGVVSDYAKHCSWGNSVDGCLHRDNFESGDLCYWNPVQGGPGCT